jgi:putative DNA primase/helicase
MTEKKKNQFPEALSAKLKQWQKDREACAADDAPAAAEAETDADEAVVEYCAELDHSDTDNGKRLNLHFGKDLLVVAQEKAKDPLFAVWSGAHWDIANGKQKAKAVAQKLGDRIKLESLYIKPTHFEAALIEKGAEAEAIEASARSETQREAIRHAEKAKDSYQRRVSRKLDFAVSSKNTGKINSALECLAPHILRHPDDFNADKMAVAVENATLRFKARTVRQKNPRFQSLEDTPDAPEYLERCVEASLDVIEGHRRDDLITDIVPVRYDAKAKCPRWDNFLRSKLPDPEVRKLVQISSGLGLTGITVQYLFFHYGDGANGKSVYMETLCRVLGSMAVTLPATSFIGEGGGSGSASPDLARLFGKRLLRVKELPEGEDLRENLVKEVTGGETVAARDLFAGYMDFLPRFIAIMSGNGYPKITGVDDGIWRRMCVVHWPNKIDKLDRREFEEVMAYFEPEYSGILNWLIEGVKLYLREGMVIPEAVLAATEDYRAEMDKTAGFVSRCIERNDKAPVLQGKELYQRYLKDCEDQGEKYPMSLTRFGNEMGRKFKKERKATGVVYYGITLIWGAPARDERNPPPHDEEPMPDF